MSAGYRERQAASRARVAAGAALGLALLAGIVAGVEALRHPPVIVPVPAAAPDEGDPRIDIECPSEPPSGDRPRQVTSDDLYECPALHDGAVVVYEGEVVGAIMRRRDGAWTQLNDDAYAGDLGPLPAHRQFRGGNAGIGVHLPQAAADGVEQVGGPEARGDVLRVVGTFHRVDSISGEVAVIRATGAELVRRGEVIDHTPMRDRQAVGVVVALAAIAVLGAERIAARSQWRDPAGARALRRAGR